MTRMPIRIRLAAVASHPIQYQVPFFRRLAARPEVDLTVLFASRMGLEATVDPEFGRRVAWDIPLTEGYAHRFLREVNVLRYPPPPAGLLNPGLPAALAQGRFDAVFVHSYATTHSVLAWLTAAALGIPVLLRTESPVRERPWYVDLPKRAFLAAFLRGTAACLVIGERNRAFYRHYGVDPSRLFDVPYAVDNDRFAAASGARDAERARLGLEGRCAVLFSGKLIERKRPGDVLAALARIPRRGVTVLVAGDGALRDSLARAAAADRLDVRFLGFVNQAGLPNVYAAADLLVLPSEFETWGLVVNEAMAVGLPVVVSDGVGCGPDLVREGENGAIYPVGDVDALARALDPLVASEDLRRRYGLRSREIVARYSFDADVEGILKALSAVCRGNGQPAPLRLPVSESRAGG